MKNLLTAKWPFYIGGTLFALLAVLALYVFNDVLGFGDSLTVVGEYCRDAVVDQAPGEPPPLDWRLGLLIGLFAGALVAALAGGGFRAELLAEGDGSFTVRTLRTVGGGLAGGFLVMLGIQLAGDSVAGAFAAAMQSASGAWVFLIAAAVSGGTLAILLERRGDGGKSGKGARAAAPRAAGKGK